MVQKLKHSKMKTVLGPHLPTHPTATQSKGNQCYHWFMVPFSFLHIHSFSKYWLSSCCVPGTVRGPGDTAGNRWVPPPWGWHSSGREQTTHNANRVFWGVWSRKDKNKTGSPRVGQKARDSYSEKVAFESSPKGTKTNTQTLGMQQKVRRERWPEGGQGRLRGWKPLPRRCHLRARDPLSPPPWSGGHSSCEDVKWLEEPLALFGYFPFILCGSRGWIYLSSRHMW